MTRAWLARSTTLGPYLALVALFLVLPALALVDMSFRQHSPVKITGEGFTFMNYARIGDGFYIRIIVETIKLAFISTVVGTILAYPVAYVMARSDGALKTLLTLLVMIPLMTSVVVKVLGWYIALGSNGFVNRLLIAIAVGRVRLLENELAVLVGLIEFALPFMIFSLTSSIERIPRNVEEAAANLGAGPPQIFFAVILPLSRPGLLSGFLLCFGVSSSAYVVPAILGGTSVRMISQQIYDDVLVAFNWPAACALSVILVICLGSISYMAISLNRRRR